MGRTSSEAKITYEQIRTICTVVRCVEIEQLKDFIAEIDREETFGPMFDPTTYVTNPHAFDNLRNAKKLAVQLLKLRETILEITGE